MSGANISLIALIGAALCCAAVPDSHAQNLDFRHDCPRAVSLFRQDTLTLRFFGDMMMHSAQISHAGKNGTYDFSGYFCHLKDLIEEADIAVNKYWGKSSMRYIVCIYIIIVIKYTFKYY